MEPLPSLVMTGATGFLGTRLRARLRNRWTLRVLSHSGRGAHPDSSFRWDPEAGILPAEALDGVRVAVHLAGAGIASGRWTPQRKRRILESRVQGTRLLAEHLAGLATKPRVLLCASAIGYYGDTRDRWVDERDPAGEGFLPEVCQAWEAAADPARHAGIRVVHLRIGVVLARGGGALDAMLPLFRLGLGGPLGGGRQCMSWIGLPDLLAAAEHCLETPSLAGPVNAVSPHPVSNTEFTRTLGRVLHRPAFLPVPAFAPRLLLGEMATELLLTGARVRPTQLLESGFRFHEPELEAALVSALC